MAMLLEAHSSDKEEQLEAFFRASNTANMLNLVAPQKIVLQFSEAMACFTDNGSIETLYVEASKLNIMMRADLEEKPLPNAENLERHVRFVNAKYDVR